MERKGSNLDARSLLLGIAAGAGAVIAGNSYFIRHPERRVDQRLVNRALDRKFQMIHEEGPIRLGVEHRYIIFSDHHKGARNRADAFRQCEDTYLTALDYNYDRGYTLIILGDAEELLEEKIQDSVRSYENVLQREGRFHPDCLIRVYGNHDIHWLVKDLVKQYMDPFFTGIEYKEGLIFQYMDGEHIMGEILLIHGFQGTLDSDIFSFLAKLVLPYYRNFQIRTGLGGTSPSRDACLRSLHDNRLYRWISQKSKLILIAGHTHRPVWSSKTHLEKLTAELYELLNLKPEQQPANYEEQVIRKKREIEERMVKSPPCNDIVKTKPSYFNTGCCQFMDGDITGIELENGTLRLIKWGKQGEDTVRRVLEQSGLSEIFLFL